MPKLIVREVKAKTILSKTGIPGDDWVVNPYTGCSYGCKYCYAFFVGRFRHPDEEWGTYVDAKVNAPELLVTELTRKLSKANTKDVGSIWFSSVTDPYQGLEAKFQLTRQCLKVLVDLNYEGRVSILTKSHLVTRDIDLYKKLKNVEVGVTVTSPGDPITAYLETYAPPHQERIKALKRLHQAGIKTYAFVGPLLPHLVWQEDKMKELFASLDEVGVNFIFL
jgi:DNA repair photolyase